MTLIVVYSPGMERSEEERDGFWEELKGCIEVCEDREKVVIIGYMNARVGDREVEGVVSKFEVSGANENGRKLIEIFTVKRLSVGNTFFEKKDINKFKWESGVDDLKSLVNLMVVQEREYFTII